MHSLVQKKITDKYKAQVPQTNLHHYCNLSPASLQLCKMAARPHTTVQDSVLTVVGVRTCSICVRGDRTRSVKSMFPEH